MLKIHRISYLIVLQLLFSVIIISAQNEPPPPPPPPAKLSNQKEDVSSSQSSSVKQIVDSRRLELVEQTGHAHSIDSLAFSPDEKILATSSPLDSNIKLWDVKTGKMLRTLHLETFYPEALLAFSSNGKMIAYGLKINPQDAVIKQQWDIINGNEIKTIEQNNSDVQKELLRIFPDFFAKSNDEAIAKNGNLKVKTNTNGDIEVFNLQNGTKLKTVKSLGGAFALSSSGTMLAIVDLGSLDIWNTQNWQKKSIIFLTPPIESLALSANNQILASGSYWGSDYPGGRIKIWDLVEGRLVKTIDVGKYACGPKDPSLYIQSDGISEWLSVAISPDGKTLASGDCENGIKLWDINANKINFILKHPSIYSVSFSPDGKTLVSSSEETIKLWNSKTGKLLKTFDKKDTRTKGIVSQLAPDFFEGELSRPLSKDKNLRFQTPGNGMIIILNEDTEEELCRLIAIGENDWLVTTPEGLFDGTPNAWKQLIWRFDNNTFDYVPVEAFFKEFYRPSLLQDIFAGNRIEPPTLDLSQIDIRQPLIKISTIDEKSTDSTVEIAKKTVKVKVKITDNIEQGRRNFPEESSDAKDVRLFRDGSLVKLWSKEIGNNKTGSVFDLTEKDGCKQFVATKENPRKAVCETDVQITAGDNQFTAYGFNHANVKSNDDVATVVGAESLKRKGKLQVLAIGINDYLPLGKAYPDLDFAVKDAVDFGVELRKQQEKLNNYDTPEVVQLTDGEATKQNILYALERFAKGENAAKPKDVSVATEKKISAINKTQPEDVLIVYFAGHGTAAKDRFYLIPTDGFPEGNVDTRERLEQLQRQSISDLELEAVFRDLDAGRLLFVIDACNSGQALEAEEKRRGPMNSRGLAQLAYEKGMYILTAAQSYQAALEVSRTPTGKAVEHGLLTYSLLEGLNTLKADVDENKQITEREWFNFAVQKVPQMQLEEMKQRSAEVKQGKRTAEVFFVAGDKNKDAENRALQTPRVFYRRETGNNPLVISKP